MTRGAGRVCHLLGLYLDPLFGSFFHSPLIAFLAAFLAGLRFAAGFFTVEDFLAAVLLDTAFDVTFFTVLAAVFHFLQRSFGHAYQTSHCDLRPGTIFSSLARSFALLCRRESF
jgi:hypothetical protein